MKSNLGLLIGGALLALFLICDAQDRMASYATCLRDNRC